MAAWYKFDGNAYDSTDNLRDGNVSGAIPTEDRNSEPESAYYFDGNDSIAIPDAGNLSYDASEDDYSVCVWIKPEGIGSIIMDNTAKSYEGYSYSIYVAEDNTIHAKLWNLTQESDLGMDSPITYGQWYHVAFIVDRLAAFLYVNGQLERQIDLNAFTTKNTSNVIVGDGFTGSIDDLRIYSRAITNTEISYLSDTAQFQHVIPETIPAEQIVNGSQDIAFTVTEKVRTKPVTVEPSQHFVSPDGQAPAGQTWASVNTDIQSAIDEATAGDIIFVNDGTYAPITIDKNLTLKSVNGPEVTVIDGLGQQRCVSMLELSTFEGLKVCNGRLTTDYLTGRKGAGIYAEKGCVIDNCIIENCTISMIGRYPQYAHGGGIFTSFGNIKNSSIISNTISINNEKGGISSFGAGIYIGKGKIINCDISNNIITGGNYNGATLSGGGVYATDQNSVIIKDATINNNGISFSNECAVSRGAGIHGATVINSHIHSNSITSYSSETNAFAYGGGANNCNLENCQINNNSILARSTDDYDNATALGGAAYNSTLTNCTVVNNSASGQADASIFVCGAICSSTAKNTIIYKNSASITDDRYHENHEVIGAGAADSSSTLSNCLIYDNTCNSVLGYVTYPNCASGCQITNPVVDDPLFVDLTNGDFHLLETSPCINKGFNAYVTQMADLDDNQRIWDVVVDIGAYEYGSEPYIEETDNTSGMSDPMEKITLLYYSRIKDNDLSGDASLDDEIVLSTYELEETQWELISTDVTIVKNPDVKGSSILGTANLDEDKYEQLFKSTPDGWINVHQLTEVDDEFTIMDDTLFSSHFAGETWYELCGVTSIDSTTLLAGLVSDFDESGGFRLVFWDSLPDESPQQNDVAQTAPLAEITTSSVSGGKITQIELLLTDAEGNSCTPVIQYRIDSGSEWQTAAINAIDGQSYDVENFVTALPDGTIHTLLWDTTANLGENFNGTVDLRAICQDVSMLGQFSSSVQFKLDTNDNTGVPAVAITTPPVPISYFVDGVVLSGTANQNVAQMWVINHRTDDRFDIDAAALWQSTEIFLEQGDNSITVYGANSEGYIVSQNIVIHRNRYNVPIITVDPVQSPVRDKFITLSGTCNEHVAGNVVYFNEDLDETFEFEATSSWLLPEVEVIRGENRITFTVKNNCGESESVEIVVVRKPVSLPWLMLLLGDDGVGD